MDAKGLKWIRVEPRNIRLIRSDLWTGEIDIDKSRNGD